MMQPTAITSIALNCPIGTKPQDVLKNLQAQKSGIKPLRLPGIEKLFYAGAADFVPEKELACWDRAIAMCVQTSMRALRQANISDYNRSKTGLCVSTPKAGMNMAENAWAEFDKTGKLPDNFILNLFPSTAGCIIAQKTGITGPAVSSAAACNSGISALELASNMLNTGKVNAVLAGCAESSLTPCVLSSYAKLGVLNAKTPAEFKPFDKNRCGFFTGEGAGAVVIEPLRSLLDKKVDFPAVIRGLFCASEAFAPVAPEPYAKAAIKQIKNMLAQANLTPDDIDYVNLHGSATKANDLIELKILAEVFGPKTKVLASSTKPYTGHLLSAAGITEIIISVIAAVHGVIPGNLNLTNPECFADCLPIKTVTKKVRNIMSLNFGFGSSTGAIILSVGQSAIDFAQKHCR